LADKMTLASAPRARIKSLATQGVRALPWFLIVLPVSATVVATGWSAATRGLGQDAAAWAQAAGSILAIAAAIWISDRENARRRKERIDEQEASVWAVIYALRLAEKESAVIYWELKETDGIIEQEKLKEWQTMCLNSRDMLRYSAARIDHFHPGFAQEAHNAVILANEVVEDINSLKNGDIGSSYREIVINNIGGKCQAFSTLSDRIGDRMRVVRRRLSAGKRILHDWEAYDGPTYFSEND